MVDVAPCDTVSQGAWWGGLECNTVEHVGEFDQRVLLFDIMPLQLVDGMLDVGDLNQSLGKELGGVFTFATFATFAFALLTLFDRCGDQTKVLLGFLGELASFGERQGIDLVNVLSADDIGSLLGIISGDGIEQLQ